MLSRGLTLVLVVCFVASASIAVAQPSASPPEAAAANAAPVPAARDKPPPDAEGAVETAAGGEQEPLSASAYTPITGSERVNWIVTGTVGLKSLVVVGPLAAGWDTALNSPEEWGNGWSGFGKRYAQRLADVAISSSIEAGLGALWGEEPRYVPSGRRGIWPRAGYTIKTVFVAQRPDGSLKPAWGRYAGNVFNNLIENTWLPASTTTASQTIQRVALGFLGRLAGNAWDEYWPDARKHFFHR